MSVLGKTRSGKSTALYRLVARLVPLGWSRIIVLDGKRDTLAFAAKFPGVEFYNSLEIDQWAEALTAVSEGMSRRYDELEAGRDPDPVLIVADEIQAGTRDKKYRGAIKDALMLISEQSGALGDCLILASQRAQNAIPPAVMNNCNCRLTMLGYGYFYFAADDQRPKVGRATFISPEAAQTLLLSPAPLPPCSPELTPNDLLTMLEPQTAEAINGRLTLFTGAAGSGLTHNLMSYSESNGRPRTISVNLAATTHKQMIEEILYQCSAATPAQAKMDELAAMAGLAVASKESLLVLDNLHLATPRSFESIQQILPFAAETAVSFALPVTTSAKLEIFDWLAARGNRVEIEPLTKSQAEKLAAAHLAAAVPHNRRADAARRIAQISHGHPKTIVAAAKAVETAAPDELRNLSGRRAGEWSLLWLVVAFVIVIVAINSDRMNSYTATAVVLVVMLILRRLLSRSLRTVIPRR